MGTQEKGKYLSNCIKREWELFGPDDDFFSFSNEMEICKNP